MKRSAISARLIVRRVVLVLAIANCPIAGYAEGSVAVNARCGGIEYRLETSSDEPNSKEFAWWDGKVTRHLASHAFLNSSDFRSAQLRQSPPLPGLWDIVLSHTASGASKYAAVANADRERQFSIVVGGKIVQSYAFPPIQKGLNSDGTSAGSFPKGVADRLLNEIRESIGNCARK